MGWRVGLIGVLLLMAFGTRAMAGDWRTASREPTGIAPDPSLVREAVVQVYAARAWGWRGRFAVHSWIAVKPTDAPAFTVYEVIGWRAYHGQSALAVHTRPADGRWFGAEPELLFDLRGPEVDEVIQRIDRAARSYPHANSYRAWPGPNSNTFTAHVVRDVPELTVDLPPTAIGKDYLTGGLVAPTPSGSGYQISLFGLIGFLVGLKEGLEVNLLGLVFGVDPDDLALKLPMVGRVTWVRKPG
jgi:hypothetical protein